MLLESDRFEEVRDFGYTLIREQGTPPEILEVHAFNEDERVWGVRFSFAPG